jgi:hypothetical protein
MQLIDGPSTWYSSSLGGEDFVALVSASVYSPLNKQGTPSRSFHVRTNRVGTMEIALEG